MITYIVSVYLGPRKSKLSNRYWDTDIYYFVRKHLEFLNTAKLTNIGKVIFVVNHYNTIIDSGLNAIIAEYTFKHPVDVVFRKNQGFSYAAWNDIIKREICNSFNELDYFFLIEDDYVPIDTSIFNKLIDVYVTDDKNGYLCQVYMKDVASVSNGMISYKVAKAIYENHGTVFNVKNITGDYNEGVWNQMHFTHFITEDKFKIIDMQEISKISFLESSTDVFSVFGDISKPELIIPIQSAAVVTLNEKHNADFVISTRNTYSDDFLLHDDIVTTAALKSFVNTIYTIEYFNKPVGYIAIYNKSIKNKYCYLEMCIEPFYVNTHIGTMALQVLIELYSDKYNKLLIEFPVDNEIAKHLAIKLGFELESTMKQHILRGKKYFDASTYVYFVKRKE